MNKHFTIILLVYSLFIFGWGTAFADSEPPHKEGWEEEQSVFQRWVEKALSIAVRVRDSGSDALEELKEIVSHYVGDFDSRLDGTVRRLKKFWGDADTPAEMIQISASHLKETMQRVMKNALDYLDSAEIPRDAGEPPSPPPPGPGPSEIPGE